MKHKKIKLLLLKLAIISTFFIIEPIKIHAITTTPELTAYQLNNHAKLEWSTEISDSDVLYKSDFESGQLLPNLTYGWGDYISTGGQSITTEDKYSGANSLKIYNTINNGNWINYPSTYNNTSLMNWGLLHFDNGTPLSITFYAKTNGTASISPFGDGNWGNSIINFYTNVNSNYYIVSNAYSGQNKIKLNTVAGINIGDKVTTDTDPNTISFVSNISAVDTTTNTITLLDNLNRTIYTGEQLKTRPWRDTYHFNSRSLISSDSWKRFSINTFVNNYSDYNVATRGSTFYISTITPDTLYIDNVKLGYASQSTVFRNGTAIYSGYLSDYEDNQAVDVSKPNEVSNLKTTVINGTPTISWNAPDDNGTTYNYTVQGLSKGGVYSAISQNYPLTITSGIKGYSVSIDSNPNGVPDGTITTTSTNYTVPTSSLKTGGFYVHVASVDNAGNMSDVNTYQYNDVTPPTLNLNTVLDGETGHFEFENNQVINTINGKTYIPSGTNSYIQGHTGNGFQSNQGQASIPLSDLGIDDNTQTVSVSYWFKWNGENAIMPIGFNYYDAYIVNGFFGFNTAGGDVYGINNPYVAGQYSHTVVVFNKNDYSLNSIYINGVKQTLTQKLATQNKAYATFQNNLNISGWSVNNSYRYNGSSIDNVRIFNRGLTDTEAYILASDGNISSFSTKPIILSVTTGDSTSGISKIKLPDNSYVASSVASYTVAKNGTYTFVAYDNMGNQTTKSITVSCYDETAPTLIATPNTTNWISTLNAQKHTLRLSTYAFNTKEGTITPATYLDGSAVQTLTRGLNLVAYDSNFNIIKNMSYDTYGNQSLCDNLANDINTLPNGSLIALQSYDAYNINDNLRNVFKTIGIPNATTMNTDADSGIANQNQRITLQFVIYKGETTPLLFDYDRNGYTIADNTILVGNTGMYETISSIDTESKPNIIVLPNGSRLYNNSLSLTNLSIKYLVYDNGTYSFKTTDNVGNTMTNNISVTNIDNILPTLNLTQNITEYTTGDVVITAKAIDGESGISQIQLPNGTWFNGSNINYTVNTNGTYKFSVKDNVGNITTKSITISNIDKEAPIVTISQNPDWTNGSTVINVKAVDNVSGVKQIILPNGNIVPGNTANYTVNDIGVYYFKAIDNTGNIGINYIVVSNIDKNKPTVTITNNKNWSNANSENVTITATDN